MNQEVFYIIPFPEVIQCSTVRIVPVGVVNGKTLSKAKAERLAKQSDWNCITPLLRRQCLRLCLTFLPNFCGN